MGESVTGDPAMKTVPVIADFDGEKFAKLYNLGPFDFRVDGELLVFPDYLPDEPIQEVSDTLEVHRRKVALQLLDRSDGLCILIRAVVLMLMVDELNIVRGWLRDFMAQVAAATSLADLKTRVAALPNLPDRTATQIKPAIKNQISSGSAD